MRGGDYATAAEFWQQSLASAVSPSANAGPAPAADTPLGSLLSDALADAHWSELRDMPALVACSGRMFDASVREASSVVARRPASANSARDLECLREAARRLRDQNASAILAVAIEEGPAWRGVALALKREADAERDGDAVYAILQPEDIPSTCAVAEICLPANDSIEATEWRALRARIADPERVVPQTRAAVRRCESEFDRMAAVVRIAFALHTRIIPPSEGVPAEPGTGFYETPEPLPWIHGDVRSPRHGIVLLRDSTGILSGAVLREYTGSHPHSSEALVPQKEWEVFTIAAPDRARLLEDARDLLAAIEACPNRFAGGAYSTGAGAYRLAIVGKNGPDFAAKLRQALQAIPRSRRRPQIAEGVYYGEPADAAQFNGKLAFLFPGFNSEYPGMFRDLCLHFPSVREWFDCMDRFAGLRHGFFPSDLVFPPPGGMAAEEREAMERELKLGGPSSLVASLAMFDLLRQLGVEPDCIAGHSNGENAALISAGILQCPTKESVFDIIQVVTTHFRKTGRPHVEGFYLAVSGLSCEQIAEVVAASDERVCVAMENCSNQMVLYAYAEEDARVRRRLEEAGGLCLSLAAERPYHTPFFGAQADFLRSTYSSIGIGPGRYPVYSTALAAPFPDDPENIRAMALLQWTQPVRFQDTIRRMYEDGVRIFVEAGPDATLTGFVKDILRGQNHLAVASNSRHKDGLEKVLQVIAALFALGRTTGRFSPAPKGKFPLPKSQQAVAPDVVEGPAIDGDQEWRSVLLQLHFALMNDFLESQRRVLSAAAASLCEPEAALSEHAHASSGKKTARPAPMLGKILEHDGRRLYAERLISIENDTFLLNHMLGRSISRRQPELHALPIVPFTMTMEIIAEAALSLVGSGRVIALSDMRGFRWLAADRGRLRIGVEAEALSSLGGGAAVRVRVFELDAAAQRSLAFEGTVHLASDYPASPQPLEIRFERPAAPEITTEFFFEECTYNGRVFRGIERVPEMDGGAIVAQLFVPPVDGFLRDISNPEFQIPGPLLDSTGQLAGYWLAELRRCDFGIFPFFVQGYRQYAPAPAPGGRTLCRSTMGFESGVVTCSFDFLSAERIVWARMEGMQLRVFETDWVKRFFTAHRPGKYFSESWTLPGADGMVVRRIDTLSHDFLEQSWGIWSRVLAHLILSRNELDFWYDLPAKGRRRIDWLLGRVAAKDAVRIWAHERFLLELDPPDIEILPAESGQPSVRCSDLAPLGEAPTISITHSGGTAAAVVHGAGAPVGIDLEVARERRSSAWISGAFADAELQFLDGDTAEVLALWCAKEAAAKTCGQGLGGRPDEWIIESLSADRRSCVVRRGNRAFDVWLWWNGEESVALCHRMHNGQSPENAGLANREEERHEAYAVGD